MTFMNQDASILGLKVCLNSTSLNFVNVYMLCCCEADYDYYLLFLSKMSKCVTNLIAEMSS